MLLKFWAFIYRLTGYYSDYANLQCHRFIMNKLPEIYQMAKKEEALSNDPYPLSFEDFLSIEIGSWQAANGFYRRFRGF